MAIMSDADRIAIWSEYMRDISAAREGCPIVKADLKAAFDATDDWVSANSASFNSALPLPARNGLTASQKARLFMAVLTKRFNLGT